jgi:thioredoxin 1
MLIELNPETKVQEYFSKGKLTIAKFYTTTCQPCQLLTPIFEDLSNMSEFNDVNFLSINARLHPQAKEFYIKSIPSIIYFKGNKMILQEIGYHPKQYFYDLIKQILV